MIEFVIGLVTGILLGAIGMFVYRRHLALEDAAWSRADRAMAASRIRVLASRVDEPTARDLLDVATELDKD